MFIPSFSKGTININGTVATMAVYAVYTTVTMSVGMVTKAAKHTDSGMTKSTSHSPTRMGGPGWFLIRSYKSGLFRAVWNSK